MSDAMISRLRVMAAEGAVTRPVAGTAEPTPAKLEFLRVAVAVVAVLAAVAVLVAVLVGEAVVRTPPVPTAIRPSPLSPRINPSPTRPMLLTDDGILLGQG